LVHRERIGIGVGATLCATLASAGAARATDYTVNTLGDPGPGGTTSLRQAIAAANGDAALDRVLFASGLTGTIHLTGTKIDFNQPLDIEGPGADQLTIDGALVGHMFDFYPFPVGKQFTIAGLTLSGVNNTSAFSDGGAIIDNSGALTIRRSVITGNSVTDQGGAIFEYHSGASLTVIDSTLTGNSAAQGGAIGTYGTNPADQPSMTIVNSTISGNHATTAAIPGEGGGIFGGAAVNVQNSTLANNTATLRGGALRLAGSVATADIKDSTISGNSAGSNGGGTYGQPAATPALADTIIAGNSAPSGGPDLSGLFSARFSIIGDPAGATISEPVAGSNQLGVNPQLGPLAANGGPTETMLPAASSPALDQGSSFALASDQRGEARPFDFPTLANSGAAGADGADIGAVEIEVLPTAPQSPAAAATCQGKTATISGSAARDVLRGTKKADVIAAAGGNDRVSALGGNDLVCGGAGKDKLIGGAGNDRLNGEGGADKLLGGGGRDKLKGGPGKDTLIGGAGHDALNGGPGKDQTKQ
jgi:RTX calcium-binding nonapeptide repeat (4 copies)